MLVNAQKFSLSGRVFLWITSIILIIGLVLPEANVAATAANSPSATGSFLCQRVHFERT